MKDNDPWEMRNKCNESCDWLLSLIHCKRQRWGSPANSLSWGVGSWESREIKAARVEKTEFQKWKSCTQKEFWRSAEGAPRVFSWVLMSACMCGHYQGLGKNYPRGSMETVPSAHTGSEIVLVPMKQGENLMIFCLSGDSGRLPSRSCLSSKELLALK